MGGREPMVFKMVRILAIKCSERVQPILFCLSRIEFTAISWNVDKNNQSGS